ncbi:MAG: nucleoside-diphosphate sugar epimerase/dehydratase [Acidobacteriota bacterium]|nr:nucleoside-diphosphate sugar epimerase/dehydratase [Acidobacteriota bacterium]
MKNRYVLLLDLPLIALAAFAAFTARFDFAFYAHREEFVPYLLFALATKPWVFGAFGMYRRYWQYTTIPDVGMVFAAVATSSVLTGAFVVFGLGQFFDEFSRVVVLTDLLMTFAAVAGLRVGLRVIHESTARRAITGGGIVAKRILIVGAGAAGTLVAREMRRNPQLAMEPVGFLDDDAGKIGKQMAGLTVLGPTRMLPALVKSAHVDTVVIAMPTAEGRTVRGVVDMCREAGVPSQTIPGMFELLDGQVSVSRLRQISIEDLLRRNPVTGHGRGSEFLQGRVVLITGAGGSIGSELARQIAGAAPSCLALVGHGENSIFEAAASLRAAFPGVRLETVIADIRDQPRLAQVFNRISPAVVFHAAAHKHVPLMEDNPEEAITNNVIGTRNVVNAALQAGTERLVLISTDKAVSPSSIMGASKRVAELIVHQAARQSGRAFVAVRFGNVLGSRGSVVHTFKSQIERGGPVTVTHPEMTRFFMTIPEAVHLVLQASGAGKGGELFVLDMGEPVRIVDLAEDLIRLSGFTTDDIPIVFSGIRPGEKMHEALFEEGLRTRPTMHPEVLEVVGEHKAGVPLDAALVALETAASAGDHAMIEATMAQLCGLTRRPPVL